VSEARAPTRADAPLFVLENLSIPTGAGRYRIPRLEIYGSPQDAATFLAAFAVSGDDSPSQRIRALKAALIVAPEVTVETETIEQRHTFVYHDVRMEGVADGLIKRMTSERADFSSASSGRAVNGQMGRSETLGIDVGAMVRLYAEQVPADAPLATIYESFSAERYTFTIEGASIVATDLTGGGIRMGSIGRPWAQVSASFASGAEGGGKPDSEARAKQLLGDARRVLNAFELGSVTIGALVVTPKNGATSTLNDVALTNFRGGKFSLRFASAEFGQTSRAKMKGFDLVDFDINAAIDLISKIGQDPNLIRDLNPAAALPRIKRFALEELALCGIDEGACKSTETFSIGGLSLERVDRPDGVDHVFGLKRFQGVVKDGSAIAGRASGRALWNRDEGALQFNDLSAGIDGFGAVTGAVSIENVTKGLFADHRQAAMLALAPVSFRSADLRLVDEGGVDKAAPRTAPGGKGKKARVLKPHERRAALAAEVTKDIGKLDKAPAAKQLTEAIKAFVVDPARPLTIRLKASPSIGLIDAVVTKDPKELWRRVTVTTARD
jgi:hypothetical protein